jgi:hypothetical protein
MTLVVAGPDGPARHVEEVVQSWVEAGLLQPTLWLKRSVAAAEPSHALTGLRLQAGGSAEVSMLEELARRDVLTVRLLSVHLAVDADADPTLGQESEGIAALLQEFLAESQQLERLNLVIPATGVVGLDPGLVKDPGIKHILVSPEDRVTDRHASRQLVWPEGGYTGHAALAIATIAGLWWATGDAAPFDNQQFTGSAQQSQTVVARAFARVLRADELGDRVTAEVFERRRTEAWTAAAVDAVDTPNPAQLMEDIAEQLAKLEGGAITYRPPQPLPEPRKQHVGSLQALTMLLRFIVGKLRAVPSQIVDRVTEGVRTAIEGFAQRVTFGEDSLVRVGARGGGTVASEPPALHIAGQADQLLRDLGRSASPPATAKLWQALRRVAFGLVDAGPFPEDVEAPTDGARRLVVNDTSFVVSDPDEPFEINRATLGTMHPLPLWALDPIMGWDVARLRDLRDLLVTEQALAEKGQDVEDADEGESGSREPDPELAARLVAVVEELDRYRQRHESSLLWRLSETLGDSLRAASNSFRAALKIVRGGQPSEDDNKMVIAARWLRRRWVAIFLLALLIPAAAWYGDDRDWWTPMWGAVAGVAVTVWLVGWFISFVRYQRRIFQIQYEIDRRHRDYLNAVARVEHDAVETVRLASLYRQFLDWAAIIAWMIHHPEGKLERRQGTELPNPAQAPFALRVAEGVPSEDTLQRTSAIVGRGIFSRGWLGGLYGSYAKESIRVLKHQLGLPDEAPDPDADRDLSSPSPRAFIRSQVQSGIHAPGWHARVRGHVDDALAGLAPGELFERVRGLTEEDLIPEGQASTFLADAAPTSGVHEHHLLPHLWRNEAQYAKPFEVTRSVLWAPPQVAETVGEKTELRPSALADEALAGAFVLAVVRCDVTDGSPVDHFAVFRQAAEAVTTLPPVGDTPG